MRIRRTGAVVTAIAVLLGLTAFLVWVIARPEAPLDRGVVLACLAAAALGEILRVQAADGRALAPITTAAGTALALTRITPDHPLVGAAYVVLLLSVVQVSAAAALALRGDAVAPVDMANRLIGIGAVAVLARFVPLGDGSFVHQLGGQRQPGWVAVLLAVLLATIGALAETGLQILQRSRSLRVTVRRLLPLDLREGGGSSLAMVSASATIAGTSSVLGWPAVPLMLAPLVLIQFGLRRHHAVEHDRNQAVLALARLTDTTGHTPAGHSARVAETAVALGRALGLEERALPTIHSAALLHDLGQVSLDLPIPGGATVLAAPSDQQRIAAASVRIVRAAGGLDDVAELLEHQTTPYRQVRELGEEVPVAARVLKVANAYVDLTGGSRGPGAHERAMERLTLGLGYEYDPAVVAALEEVRALYARTGPDQRSGPVPV